MFSVASIVSAVVLYAYGVYDAISTRKALDEAHKIEVFYNRCNKLLACYHDGTKSFSNASAYEILHCDTDACSYRDTQKVLEFLESKNLVYRRPSDKYHFFWNKKREKKA